MEYFRSKQMLSEIEEPWSQFASGDPNGVVIVAQALHYSSQDSWEGP